ncbi:MAG: class I tRNA ligase family protein, partial [Bdellovibrionales bacterium]|nr:class I tRNA ligase family protein [Bdellovibrionales bacterium]
KTTGEVLEKIAAKMSKSLKNVVNPDDIVKEFGADTLRLHMMFMGPLQGTRMWDSQAISGTNRFLRKAWRFVTGEAETGFRPVVNESDQDPTVYKALNRTIKKVGDSIEEFQFNTPIAAMMEFLNESGAKDVSKSTLEKFTLILSPFAPHLAEELWMRLGNQNTLAYEKFPVADESALKAENVQVVVQVNGKKRSLMEVSASIDEGELKDLVIKQMADTAYPVSGEERFITVYKPGTKVPKLVNILK